MVEGRAGSRELLCYDYLVLCMGTQFQLPAGVGLPIPQSDKQFPEVFSPSDEQGIAALLAWVKKNLLSEDTGELPTKLLELYVIQHMYFLTGC